METEQVGPVKNMNAPQVMQENLFLLWEFLSTTFISPSFEHIQVTICWLKVYFLEIYDADGGRRELFRKAQLISESSGT